MQGVQDGPAHMGALPAPLPQAKSVCAQKCT